MTLAADQARPQRATPHGFDPRNRARDVLAELHRLAVGTAEATVTVAYLADRLEIAERTVQRAITRLVDAGLLEVARPCGGGWRGVPNVYRLLPLAVCPGQDTATIDERRAGGR